MSSSFRIRTVLMALLASTLMTSMLAPQAVSAQAGSASSQSINPASAANADETYSFTPAQIKAAKLAFPAQYYVAKSTMRYWKGRCIAKFASSAESRCLEVQRKRKMATQVVVTRKRIMAAEPPVGTSAHDLWWLLAEPIIGDDRNQVKRADWYIHDWTVQICVRYGCGTPSRTQMTHGADLLGGPYTGLLLSRRSTKSWAEEVVAFDSALAAATFLCSRIPKAGWVGLTLIGTCVTLVIYHFGSIKADFKRAVRGGKDSCLEFRFHSIMLALADLTKVTKCKI